MATGRGAPIEPAAIADTEQCPSRICWSYDSLPTHWDHRTLWDFRTAPVKFELLEKVSSSAPQLRRLALNTETMGQG